MKLLLDDQDITDVALKNMSNSPAQGTVFPANDDWIDLLPAISKNEYLKNNFFKPGIHTLKIVDNRGSYTAKIFIKSKYSTRNR